MAFKLIVLAAALAVANAGYLAGHGAVGYAAAPAAVGYAAAPAVGYAAGPALGYAHAAPAAITSQSSNILRSYGNLGQVSTYSKTIDTPYSSVRKSDVRVSNPGYATAYAAPVAHAAYAPAAYAAPAVVAHAPAAYAAPLAARAYAAPALAAPLAARAYAAPALAGAAHGLLGVAYSAAPAVAHMTYSNAYGVNYAW